MSNKESRLSKSFAIGYSLLDIRYSPGTAPLSRLPLANIPFESYDQFVEHHNTLTFDNTTGTLSSGNLH